MGKGVFITGTDTGVGKTYVSALLMRQMVQQGAKVAGLKPIASGFERCNGIWKNEDVEALTAAANVVLPNQRVNRYRFTPAIAPHIAADQASVQINLEKIREDVNFAASKSDYVIVEGVGGWHVPLSGPPNTFQDIEMLVKSLDLPVILVVGMRLGCLNHALLSARAIQASGVTLLGWVANNIQAVFPHKNENVQTLIALLPCPMLFEVPFFKGNNSNHGSSKDLDLLGQQVSGSIRNLCQELENS